MSCILQMGFTCYACGTHESFRIRRGRKSQEWYHNHDLDNNILCKNCYARIIGKRCVADLTPEQHNRILHNNMLYRLRNKERLTIRRKEYVDRNRDKINKKHIEYYYRNRDKELRRCKIWQTKNKEILTKRRFENRKMLSEQRKERRRSNHDECIRKQREYIRCVRLKLIMLLGGKCLKCSFSDARGLQVDHINGGGRKDFSRFTNPTVMYSFYLKNPDLAREILQVLCANCNWIKLYEKNESRMRFILP